MPLAAQHKGARLRGARRPIMNAVRSIETAGARRLLVIEGIFNMRFSDLPIDARSLWIIRFASYFQK